MREVYRQVNLWTDESVSSTFLPGQGAAALLEASAAEASALLELGYRREDGIDFITSLPEPHRNPVRPVTQIRAAIHHLGGDMALFRELVQVPEPSSRALKLVFSSWPLGGRVPDAWRPDEGIISLHIQARDASVPQVVTFSRDMLGYAALTLWDLALTLSSESRTAKMLFPSFRAFAGEIGVLGS